LKKGDEVEAVVLEIDKSNQRIAVGIKQLSVDPWSAIDQYYKVGDLVTGSVTKLASFGAFVGLQHEIDGLVHISQVSEERVEKIKNVLKVGQEVTARVIKIDKSDRRIGLSIKAWWRCNTPSMPQTTRSRIEPLQIHNCDGRTGNGPPVFVYWQWNITAETQILRASLAIKAIPSVIFWMDDTERR